MIKGKKVPCSYHISPSGGITDGILVSILNKLDALEVYTRGETEPIPMIILGGLESRLDRSFIAYVNDPSQKWIFCLGVPYSTVYWQVGGSSEQNGSYKVRLSSGKKELAAFKSDHGLPLSLAATDIVPLVSKVWAASFARVESNKKAIAERGRAKIKSVFCDSTTEETTNEQTKWSGLETRRHVCVCCMERGEGEQQRFFHFQVSSRELLADCSMQNYKGCSSRLVNEET
jgi:hypothetical protein